MDPKANANYAGLLIQNGKHELAGQHLERAFQSNPGEPDAIVNMAHLQNRLGNFNEAAKYYEAALLRASDQEDLQSCLVATQIGAGDISKAIETSRFNLERRPLSAKAQLDYATALLAAGRKVESQDHCEKAVAVEAVEFFNHISVRAAITPTRRRTHPTNRIFCLRCIFSAQKHE